MILPQKKGEEGKCNYGDWTTLKPKHYRYHHIKIFKKEKIEINKKTGMNSNTFKNIIKKKKGQLSWNGEFMLTKGQKYRRNVSSRSI